jgi:adenylyl-sulfate kinase
LKNSEKTDTCDLTWQEGDIGYPQRCSFLGQQGIVIWFTGLSGSGKSTIAKGVEKELYKRGVLSYRLDGDNMRLGLNSDLGFSQSDRKENIRRLSEVAALFQNTGIVVLVAAISPHADMRDLAKSRVIEKHFIEVYIKADIETCIKRDPKGLYEKATAGKISEFTGITSPYEEPLSPDLTLDTTKLSIDECIDLVIKNIYVRFEELRSQK